MSFSEYYPCIVDLKDEQAEMTVSDLVPLTILRWFKYLISNALCFT